MTDYVVLECTQTLDFWRWGRNRFDIWVPVERRWETLDGVRVYNDTSPLPGYAFVPPEHWQRCLETAPPQYNASVLEYKWDGQPRTVSVAELREMQQVLNEHMAAAHGGPVPAPRAWVPKVGHRVEVRVPPFTGLQGVITKLRAGSVRVLIGTKFVTTRAHFLAPL